MGIAEHRVDHDEKAEEVVADRIRVALADAWTELAVRVSTGVLPAGPGSRPLDMDEQSGYQVTRLGHSLQAATRALRAGEDEEMVVCALVHDVGDVIAPANHSEVAAALLRPYVSERNYWIIKHQGLYWFEHIGADPNARARWADHPWYQACADFCAEYDQNSFDPDYPTEPLGTFEPMVRRVFDPSRVRKLDSTSQTNA